MGIEFLVASPTHPYPAPSRSTVAICPLNTPPRPPALYSFAAQSTGPLYSRGVTSGWVCRPARQRGPRTPLGEPGADKATRTNTDVLHGVGDNRVSHAGDRARRIQLAWASGRARYTVTMRQSAADVPRLSCRPGARCEKKRLAHSSAPNWIDTQAPMPSRGVNVPCSSVVF